MRVRLRLEEAISHNFEKMCMRESPMQSLARFRDFKIYVQYLKHPEGIAEKFRAAKPLLFHWLLTLFLGKPIFTKYKQIVFPREKSWRNQANVFPTKTNKNRAQTKTKQTKHCLGNRWPETGWTSWLKLINGYLDMCELND